MARTILFLILVPVFLFPPAVIAGGQDLARQENQRIGVWLTVFSEHKVLHSRPDLDRFIDVCEKCGMTDLYLQVYRADKAHYNSSLTDNTPYKNMLSGSGEDLIPALLDKAGTAGIKVHAWINLLSVAQNKKAHIFSEIGDHITTKDQHGRTALVFKKDKLDKYYIRENQLFLDPGYAPVRRYLAGIAREVLDRYPGFSGLHLDYVRYPAAVPFMPGSRFTSHGISYGYVWPNIKAFKDETGEDIRKMPYSRENYRKWDSLRRDNVTALVREISDTVRAAHPDVEISGTIVPSVQRAYLTTFQDWTRWLRKGYTDSIIIMNYTEDTRLMEMNTDAMRLPGFEDKVQIGIGAYLLKDRPETLREQLLSLKRISPAGIVIFSYDDIAENEDLQEFLSENFGRRTRTNNERSATND